MNKTSVFALVDCNNFYVSCERVFAPHLEDKAVVVLSNNDGCAISRSNEAKALGVKMGEPLFKFNSLINQGKVTVFSSNFKFYSNMSWRVMETLKSLSPSLEVYSIDEAFLNLSHINSNELLEFAASIKLKVKQWTGIPVSIGIAPNKTLAKVANHFAKKSDGIYNIIDHPQLDKLLSDFPIEEIWGIGRRLSTRLRLLGIGDAKALRDVDPTWIRKNFSITEEKIVWELRGISCLELVTIHKTQKSISHSRSFGKPVQRLEELEEALSNYVSIACEKLRNQNSRAATLCVYLKTNSYHLKQKQYNNSISLTLPQASNDTMEIITYSKRALQNIYKSGFNFCKVGIVLSDFVPEKIQQIQLFSSVDYNDSDKLMKALDSINSSLGKNTVFIAAQGIKNEWKTKSKNKSPSFTTCFEELPIIKI